ncbi:MAG: PadR family transcriptional regulator [Chloroflexi bacterium]|nr:PadR family transcriptional regulator [Chloroflexota bacterium]
MKKKENRTAFVILGLLSHENLSGYQLKKQIDAGLKEFWSAGFGQLYPTLKELREKGLIEAVTEGGNKRGLTVFSITDAGRAALKEWLRKPVLQQTVKYDILLKLYFGAALKPEENLVKIDNFRKQAEMQMEKYAQYEQVLRSVLDDSDDHTYFLLTVLFGRKVTKATLEWAEESRQLLINLKKEKKEPER